MPATHKEVARAVGLLLEEKADIHATGHAYTDVLMNLDGSGPVLPKVPTGKGGGGRAGKGPAIQCAHCKMVDG